MTRYQGDTQWQQDFGRMAAVFASWREHYAAACMLRDAGVHDEARAELNLADEDLELIELMAESLSSIRP